MFLNFQINETTDKKKGENMTSIETKNALAEIEVIAAVETD